MNLKRMGVTLYEEWYVMRLIVEEGEAKGLVMFNLRDSQPVLARARAVMLATGGYGRAFNTTSNDYASTGDGLAMAARAGIPLEDMEFVQFHPTGLYPVGVLVSEAVRGEGAYLRNAAGDRFMADYAPSRMELAPRDITSRAIVKELLAGRGIHLDGSAGGPFVHLDLRHLGEATIMSRVPFCWEEAHRLLGVNAVEEPIPVRPTIHYSMGGIPTDVNGRVRSSSAGFVEACFAAGEAACVSVHGANRLGSNSLLECIVFGRRTGRAIAQYLDSGRKLPSLDGSRYLAEARAQIQALLEHSGPERIAQVRQEFQDTMTQYCGVFRTADLMQTGLEKLREIAQRIENTRLDDRGTCWNTELIEALELRSLFTVGQTILTAAERRQESRGAHCREDYPDRNDQDYLKHTLAYWSPSGIDLQYMPVTLGLFEPQARNY
jgi:succinate dehydrogenase / fumarate reductase flavoprotein subunit